MVSFGVFMCARGDLWGEILVGRSGVQSGCSSTTITLARTYTEQVSPSRGCGRRPGSEGPQNNTAFVTYFNSEGHRGPPFWEFGATSDLRGWAVPGTSQRSPLRNRQLIR